MDFHDTPFSKDELSSETVEWLERYNRLNENDRLSVSYIPRDLYLLCGYGNTEDITVAETDSWYDLFLYKIMSG